MFWSGITTTFNYYTFPSSFLITKFGRFYFRLEDEKKLINHRLIVIVPWQVQHFSVKIIISFGRLHVEINNVFFKMRLFHQVLYTLLFTSFLLFEIFEII
jgi:hypothetical protein